MQKDFYYSFIDSTGEQISEQRNKKFQMVLIFYKMLKFSKRWKIDDAFAQVKDFKEK